LLLLLAILSFFVEIFGTCAKFSWQQMPARKKKVIRTEWPRVYLTPKDGKLVWCVDSRKTGFSAGGRRFFHAPAEALAHAEQIERVKDNEGAIAFGQSTPHDSGEPFLMTLRSAIESFQS
jgi:hypothetical protein